MTFAGLAAGELVTVGAIAGGAMVLLYVLRLRRRRVEVPFSPLWARVVEERESRSLFRRLKRLLSLLLQLAIIALVVLALGDPKLGLGGCGGKAPEPPPVRHTLVILDASASMASFEAGETRFEAARAEAHRVIEAVATHPNHRVMVVQLDARTRPVSLWSSDAEALHAAVDAVAPAGPLDTPTAVDDALALAEDALRGRELGEAVFITDRAFPPIAAERAEALRLSVIGVGQAEGQVGNVGIEAFNVRPYLDDSLTYAIFYAIRNETDRPLEASLLLYANESGQAPEDFVQPSRVVGSYALTLPAGGVLSDVINDVKFEGSRLAARVEVALQEPVRDVFPRDDVAFALVPERKILKVQLVTRGNLFLHATLFVRENVEFVTVTPQAYRGPEGYDVTVVDAADVDVSRPGNYVLIAPPGGGPFTRTGELVAPEVVRLDTRHPIARHLKLVDANILRADVLERRRGDAVVAAAQGGVPLIMARDEPESGRRMVVLSFDLRQSLLPMSYAFPLLVVNILSYFHQEDDGLLRPNRAGTELSLPTDLVGDDLALVGPPGASAHARRVGDRVHLAVDRIGIYQLSAVDGPQDQGTEAIAVNLMSREESAVAPQGSYGSWTAPEPIVIETDPWLDNLWRILLLVVLGLVLLEWIGYHRRVTV